MKIYQDNNLAIKKYFLLNSSADVVYAFFKENALKRSKVLDGHNELGECEKELLKKDHPLINLALAQYGCSKEIFDVLYANGTEEIRIALLSNPLAFYEGMLGFHRSNWMDMEDIKKLIEKDYCAEIAAFFQNPWIDYRLLERLYEKEGVFLELDERKWKMLIGTTASNPRISADYESVNGIAKDMTSSWVSYDWDRLFEKIWNLAFKVPVNKDWAITLAYLFKNTKPDVSTKYDITAALSRWPSEERVKTSEQEDAHFFGSDWFGEIRFYIAKLYDAQKGAFKKLKNSADQALRASYYEKFIPKNPGELRDCYENEKIKGLFLMHAIYNENLYKNEEIRTEMRAICSEDNAKQDYDSHWPSLFDHFSEKYEKSYPWWFKAEQERELMEDADDEHTPPDLSSEPEQASVLLAKKVSVTLKIAKRIIKKCDSIVEEVHKLKTSIFDTAIERLIVLSRFFFYPMISYFIVDRLVSHYISPSVGSILKIIAAIIGWIIAVKKTHAEEVRKNQS